MRDLAIHPRDHDLIIATHGRGIYILDDLTPLRDADAARCSTPDVAFLPSRPSAMVIAVASEQRFEATTSSRAESRARRRSSPTTSRSATCSATSSSRSTTRRAKLITTLPGGKRRGINRVAVADAAQAAARSRRQHAGACRRVAFFGPRVPEGTYTVKLIKGKETYTTQVTLVPDPRSTHTAEDRALQQETVLEALRDAGRLTYVTDMVIDTRDAIAPDGETPGQGTAYAAEPHHFAAQLEALRNSLLATRGGLLTGEEQLREKLGGLYGSVNGYEGRPTNTQLEQLAVLGGQLDQAAQRLEAIGQKDLAAVNQGLAAKKLEPVKLMTREEWEKKRPG